MEFLIYEPNIRENSIFIQENYEINAEFDKILPLYNYEGIQINEYLGEKNNTRVFKCYKFQINQLIFLKYLPSQSIEDLQNLKKEVYIYSTLKNELSINYNLYKDAYNPETHILELEIGSITLKNLYEIRQNYDIFEILYIFLNLTNQLKTLQSLGLSIRNINLDNIVLIPDKDNPNYYQYKFIDMSKACLLSKNQNKIPKKDIPQIFIDQYTAPELIEINKGIFSEYYYDPFKADVYSLAILILELLRISKTEFIKKTHHPLYFILSNMLLNESFYRLSFEEISIALMSLNIQFIQPFNEIKYIQVYEKKENISNLLTRFEIHKELKHYSFLEPINQNCIYFIENFNNIDQINIAKTYRNLGFINFYYKNYNDSIDWLMKYRALSENLDDIYKAESSFLLAFNFILINNFGLAEENLINAIKICEEKQFLLQLPIIYEELAFFYADSLRNNAKSEQIYMKSLKIKEKNYLDINLSYLYDKLALFYTNYNVDYKKSLKNCEKSLNIKERILGNLSPETGRTYIAIGLIYQMKKPDKSEYYFLLAKTIFEKNSPYFNYEKAKIYNILAFFYHKYKIDYQKSEEFYKNSFEIISQLEKNELYISSITNFAEFYTEIKCEYEKAENFYNILNEINVLNDEKTMITNEKLAKLYLKTENYNKSEQLFKKVLEYKENKNGLNDKNTALSYKDIGYLYFLMNQLELSENYYQKSLKILTNDYNLLLKLGDLYLKSKDYSKAEEYYIKSLKSIEKIEFNSDFIDIYTQIANFYETVNQDYSKSEGFYLKAIKLQQKIQLNKFEMAKIFHKMGLFYLKLLKKPDNAYKYLQKALYSLEKYEKTPQINIFYTEILIDFSLYHHEILNFSKEESILLDAMKIREDSLGLVNKKTCEIYLKLGNFYEKTLLNYEKSDNYYQKAVKIQEKICGVDHIETGKTYKLLANLYYKLKNYEKSEELYIKSLLILESLGNQANDSEISDLYESLAIVLQDSKQNLNKCEEYFLKGIKLKERIYGKEHINTAKSYNLLAGFYKNDRHDYPKTEDLYIKTLKIRLKVLGMDNLETGISYDNLAIFYHSIKCVYKLAEEHYLTAVKIYEKTDSWIELARCCNNYGNFLEFIKRDFGKAEFYYLKCLKLREKELGDNFETIKITENLRNFYQNMKNFNKAKEFTERLVKLKEKRK